MLRIVITLSLLLASAVLQLAFIAHMLNTEIITLASNIAHAAWFIAMIIFALNLEHIARRKNGRRLHRITPK